MAHHHFGCECSFRDNGFPVQPFAVTITSIANSDIAEFRWPKNQVDVVRGNSSGSKKNKPPRQTFYGSKIMIAHRGSGHAVDLGIGGQLTKRLSSQPSLIFKLSNGNRATEKDHSHSPEAAREYQCDHVHENSEFAHYCPYLPQSFHPR